MKDLKMRQFWISFVFGAALFAVLECLAPYSVYIGWLFFANQLLLNAGVCVLLSAIVYKMLCRQSTADSFGT